MTDKSLDNSNIKDLTQVSNVVSLSIRLIFFITTCTIIVLSGILHAIYFETKGWPAATIIDYTKYLSDYTAYFTALYFLLAIICNIQIMMEKDFSDQRIVNKFKRKRLWLSRIHMCVMSTNCVVTSAYWAETRKSTYMQTEEDCPYEVRLISDLNHGSFLLLMFLDNFLIKEKIEHSLKNYFMPVFSIYIYVLYIFVLNLGWGIIVYPVLDWVSIPSHMFMLVLTILCLIANSVIIFMRNKISDLFDSESSKKFS